MNHAQSSVALSSLATLGKSQPPTRPSLLIRIRADDDQQSWDQFADLYCPVIYRFCRRKGLQRADAMEVMQDVLLQIFKYIKSFEYDPDRGRFRAWLHSVIHSRLCRFWKSVGRRAETTGNDDLLGLKASQQIFDEEMANELISWAARDVRAAIEPETWQAFEWTWFEQQTPESVAKKLERSVGWVYVAKSRTLKRLAQRVGELMEGQ